MAVSLGQTASEITFTMTGAHFNVMQRVLQVVPQAQVIRKVVEMIDNLRAQVFAERVRQIDIKLERLSPADLTATEQFIDARLPPP